MGRGAGPSRPAAPRPSLYVAPIRHLNLGSTGRLSALHQQVNSPVVRMPGGSDIRRMNSKCGSLVRPPPLWAPSCMPTVPVAALRWCPKHTASNS